MAYRFEPREKSSNALTRILGEELEAAIEILRSSREPLDHRVHEVRKHLKKSRALLALAEGSAPASQLRQTIRSLRKAARALAGLRGRAALAEAFDGLDEQSPSTLPVELVRQFRALLSTQQAPGSANSPELDAARKHLLRAERRLGELHFHGSGWRALKPGFRRTYAQAKKAFARAAIKPDSEAFHAFRTPAKRHLYHIQLLEPLLPELLHPRRAELSCLGKLLGDHHDLSLLVPGLGARGISEVELSQVRALATLRCRELEMQIFDWARRLFTERPRALTRRLGTSVVSLGRS